MSAAGGERESGRLRGVVFAKQFPNPAEPVRGLFVAEQVDATRDHVDWRIVAPVPYAPRWLAAITGHACVRGDGVYDGIPVSRPNYRVLPRRLLYTRVAPSMAEAARESFRRVVSTHEPHFVHAHDLYPSGAAARRLVAGTGLPLVVSVHGSDLYSNLVRRSWRRELREVVGAAAAVVCVGRKLALDSVLEIGAAPERTVVVPDTYDADTFRPVERPPAIGRPARLLAVGRLVDVKGHGVLLRAFAAILRDGRDAELRIVGDGPERGELLRLAGAEGVAGRVRFAGTVDGPALAEAYAWADLFVLPSLREGFGVVLVEALATGLPAVATRSGGPEDILAPADGLLVEPGDVGSLADGLSAGLDRLSDYDASAISARAAQRYAPAAIGARLAAVYRAVVDGAPLDGALGHESGSLTPPRGLA